MSRKGNLVTIVPKDRLLEIDPQMIDTDEGDVTVGDVIITRIFKLKHVDTKTATAMSSQQCSRSTRMRCEAQ